MQLSRRASWETHNFVFFSQGPLAAAVAKVCHIFFGVRHIVPVTPSHREIHSHLLVPLVKGLPPPIGKSSHVFASYAS